MSITDARLLEEYAGADEERKCRIIQEQLVAQAPVRGSMGRTGLTMGPDTPVKGQPSAGVQKLVSMFPKPVEVK